MGPLDALNHLVNLLLPAIVLGLLSASISKLIWRSALRPVAWTLLAGWACGAAVLALLAGLLLTGRDGRMGTYAGMVLACALALWWAGFRRARA